MSELGQIMCRKYHFNIRAFVGFVTWIPFHTVHTCCHLLPNSVDTWVDFGCWIMEHVFSCYMCTLLCITSSYEPSKARQL